MFSPSPEDYQIHLMISHGISDAPELSNKITNGCWQEEEEEEEYQKCDFCEFSCPGSEMIPHLTEVHLHQQQQQHSSVEEQEQQAQPEDEIDFITVGEESLEPSISGCSSSENLFDIKPEISSSFSPSTVLSISNAGIEACQVKEEEEEIDIVPMQVPWEDEDQQDDPLGDIRTLDEEKGEDQMKKEAEVDYHSSLRCSQCGASFLFDAELRTHMTETHPDNCCWDDLEEDNLEPSNVSPTPVKEVLVINLGSGGLPGAVTPEPSQRPTRAPTRKRRASSSSSCSSVSSCSSFSSSSSFGDLKAKRKKPYSSGIDDNCFYVVGAKSTSQSNKARIVVSPVSPRVSWTSGLLNSFPKTPPGFVVSTRDVRIDQEIKAVWLLPTVCLEKLSLTRLSQILEKESSLPNLTKTALMRQMNDRFNEDVSKGEKSDFHFSYHSATEYNAVFLERVVL